MKGAHCLKCMESGPDLIIDGPGVAKLPTGTVQVIAFTCGGCGTPWTWRITKTDDGLVYELEVPGGMPMVQ